MTELTSLDIAALGRAYASGASGASGATDPAEVTEAYLTAIAAASPGVNAYIHVTADFARAAARASAVRWREGRAIGPLDGAPIAIKDNIDVAGAVTTNGCAFGDEATEDAEVVRRLKAAGAIILGKANLHEAALGATTNNPHWGKTHNPRRQGWTPGGSSGGSGAAVAAGLAVAALGSDTMGSVRAPAAYCGIAGIKPTYGLVSTRGVAPLAWTLDHVGPLARAPADLATILRVIAGFDPDCPDAMRVVLDDRPFLLPGLKVGRVAEVDSAEMTPEVRDLYEAFLERLAAAGARIVDVAWPGLDLARARLAGLLVSEAEAATAMAADLSTRPERFSSELKAMLAFGARASAPKLVAAERRIREARRLVLNSLDAAPVLAMPTTPMPPFTFDSQPPDNQADFCAPANFAGCPAISVPAGETAEGLPVGMQLMAAPGRDFALIELAGALAALN